MIPVVIIENDIEAKTYLEDLISELETGLKVVGHAKNIRDGVECITKKQPELVFMDIELDDGLCFELLDAFPNPGFEVIFTTAFSDYMGRAMDHFALTYLLKPIDKSLLKNAVNRFAQMKARSFQRARYELLKDFLRTKSPTLLLNTGNEHVSVKIEDISHCTADGNYTRFQLADGTSLLASNVLKHYEELLHHHSFFRASRSHLVNIGQIAKIYKKETIVMNGGDHIHVSVRNKANLSRLIDTLT